MCCRPHGPSSDLPLSAGVAPRRASQSAPVRVSSSVVPSGPHPHCALHRGTGLQRTPARTTAAAPRPDAPDEHPRDRAQQPTQPENSNHNETCAAGARWMARCFVLGRADTSPTDGSLRPRIALAHHAPATNRHSDSSSQAGTASRASASRSRVTASSAASPPSTRTQASASSSSPRTSRRTSAGLAVARSSASMRSSLSNTLRASSMHIRLETEV